MRKQSVIITIVLLVTVFSYAQQNVVNTSKSNTKDIRVKECPEGLVLKNGECVPITTISEEFNTISMKVPNTAVITKSFQISVLGNGTTIKNGIPIVIGKTIKGTVKGINEPVTVKITQAQRNDEGKAVTDKEGNFTIKVAVDTVHKIYINDVEFGKIKIQLEKEDVITTVNKGTGGWKQQGFKNETVKTRISCPEGYTMVSGKCVSDVIVGQPWFNKENGQISYFEYTEDFVIDAPEICTDLGVKRLVIQKGIYKVERKNPEEGGRIVLALKEPLSAERIKNNEARKFEGTNPKGMNCSLGGNSCFYVSGENSKADIQLFTLRPIIEKGLCTKVEVQYKGAGSPKNQGF